MHILKGIFLLLLAGGSYGATINNNGYEDVLISIHPDIPGDSVDTLITSIKKFVTDGSKLLFTATKKHLYIKSVKILLPNAKANPKWNEVSQAKQTDETLKHEDAWIKIEEPTQTRYVRQDLNLPFTKIEGREQCGQPGQHIHLTEDYLKKIDDNEYKPFRAAEFVHNWATLRFGVFDEHGYQGDPLYPLFYWDKKTKKMKANMCTNTDPKIQIGINENGKITPVSECEKDDKTNLPKKDCVYMEGASGTFGSFTGSLMVEPNTKVDSPLEVFSDNSNHNKEAPTKHNDICGRNSVWSVIEKTVDYQQASGPMTTSPPDPIFEVLQPVAGCEDSKLVFVLDTSGSMSGDRIANLKSQATDYIKSSTFLHDGTKLGIVEFSSWATVLTNTTSVTSSNRNYFVNAIQGLAADGGTSCELGLNKGLDELNGVNDQTKGGTILFMTDGECGDNYFQSTSERAKRNGVKVISFALDDRADPNMESLATATGGKFMVWTPSVSGSKTSFADLLTTGRKCVQTSGNFDVTMMKKTVGNKRKFQENFLIDKSIGRDVTLIVQNFGPAEITQIEVEYNDESKILISEQGLSITSPYEVKLDTTSSLDPGEYGVTIRFTAKNDGIVSIKSKSSSKTGAPIEIKSCTHKRDTKGNILFIAEVVKGASIVKAAEVVVTTTSDGGKIDQVTLKDQKDGSYSAYFVTQVTGSFQMECKASGNSKTVLEAPKTAGSRTKRSVSSEELSGEFLREVTGPGIKVDSVPPNYPPAKVLDLVTLLDGDDKIKIEFEATGADLDQGTATKYEIKYTKNEDLLYEDWDSIKTSDVVTGSLEPKPASQKMEFSVKRDIFDDGTVYFVALKAIDDQGLSSEISNVARFYNKKLPDIIEVKVYVDNVESGAKPGSKMGQICFIQSLAFVMLVLNFLNY